jgi:hypothetical protein
MATPGKLFLILALLLGPRLWAQKTGLLLGVAGVTTNTLSDTQDFATIHEPQYQTLWIAASASGEWKVLATLPELIVPRRDGFWHAGVKQVCEFSGSNESLRQIVWAAPAMKAATVEQSAPCTPHKPEDYAGPYSRTAEDENKISQCGFQLVNLLYVSPEVISLSHFTGQSEDCEARGGHYTLDYAVRNLDSDEPLSFAVLGPKAHDAYMQAVPNQGASDGGDDCGVPEVSKDTGWRVAHEEGRWRPYLHISLGNFGCAADEPVKIPLPASITGEASSPLDWKLLRSKVNDIADAYVSPHGDLLVAASHTEIAIYEAHAGVPGKLLLKLPASRIVMTQWATGTHVEVWTREVRNLAEQHLPEPVLHVKPTSN